MFGYFNLKLGNISVGAKLALGFAVVLALTLATTISGWRAPRSGWQGRFHHALRGSRWNPLRDRPASRPR